MAGENAKKQDKRIVIVGGGFGGAYCAARMGKRLYSADGGDVVLLDKQNYFLFYPLLVEAATGSLEPRHTIVPIRKFLKPRSWFRMAEVCGADLENRQIEYQLVGTHRTSVETFDHLVLAPGSVTKLPPVSGLREHGFQMKSLADGVLLRDRVIRMLEEANATPDPDVRRQLLHLVVVGGNYTGVETAGEFHQFMRSAAELYPNLKPEQIQTTLIEIQDRILPVVDRSLADYAMDRLRRRGVRILLNESVSEVHQDHVVLRSGGSLPTETMIWAAGVAPSPLVEKLGVPVDERGYILCERDLRVKGYQNVWAIGDSAVNVDSEGRIYPPTAQHAVQEGKHLARNLGRVLSGEPSEPCDIHSRGSLAPLGRRTAVADLMGWRFSGFPAWFLWRSFYLFRMPGISRKVRVGLDWAANLIFSRDYSQLGLYRPWEQQRAADEKQEAMAKQQ